MSNLRHYRLDFFLLALVMAGMGGNARAQENISETNSPPVIMDHKQAARLVMSRPAPQYPAVAKVNYLEGRVQLELTVNDAGKVANAHVLHGNAILADSALKATRQWVYHPLNTPSGPSGFITTVELKFTLDFRDSNLTPQQAERDFVRQIKPPQVVQPEEDTEAEAVVHLRLLLNDEGQVDDLEISPMGRQQFEAARETIRSWTFHPAHWGNLPIASYLDVDVPINAPPLARALGVSAQH